MSHIQRIVVGVSEEDLARAAGAIAKAMKEDAGTDEDTPDLLVVTRATQAWLETIVERLIAEAAWYALDGCSKWEGLFRTHLQREEKRSRAAYGCTGREQCNAI